MKKIILGIFLGILLTLGFQQGVNLYKLNDERNVHVLFDVVRNTLNYQLPEANILDIRIKTNSKVKVNYKYDKLYDVTIMYEENGINEELIIPYGIIDGVWIAPQKSTIESVNNTIKGGDGIRIKVLEDEAPPE